MASTARSASSAATHTNARPSQASASGSSPRRSHTPETSRRTGRSSSKSSTRLPLRPATSWHTVTTPPRVGSWSERTAAPAVEKCLYQPGQRTAVRQQPGRVEPVAVCEYGGAVVADGSRDENGVTPDECLRRRDPGREAPRRGPR